jgi:hypothetical protein
MHDSPDSFNIHTLCSELGNPSQARNVNIAIATVTALGPCWLQETPTFIDPQGLWMHTSQLRGN